MQDGGSREAKKAKGLDPTVERRVGRRKSMNQDSRKRDGLSQGEWVIILIWL